LGGLFVLIDHYHFDLLIFVGEVTFVNGATAYCFARVAKSSNEELVIWFILNDQDIKR